jgi:hypothetical protein
MTIEELQRLATELARTVGEATLGADVGVVLHVMSADGHVASRAVHLGVAGGLRVAKEAVRRMEACPTPTDVVMRARGGGTAS